MSLSPWDLSGNISFDFSLYRPRRPSYVFATQISKRRNESYRHATKSETSSGEGGVDFIEVIARKKRKDSYRQATQMEEIELGSVAEGGVLGNQTTPMTVGRYGGPPPVTRVGYEYPPHHPLHGNAQNTHIAGPHGRHLELNHLSLAPTCSRELELPSSRFGRMGTIGELGESQESSCPPSLPHTAGPSPVPGSHSSLRAQLSRDSTLTHPDEATSETVFSSSSEDAAEAARCQWRYRKNLIVLSLSFILVFTAFRSIQNLQSSLNTKGRLGVIAMGCVHGTMFLTCLFAPVLINKLTSKWTIVLGLLFYLFWIAANFYPHFYTLIPTSIGVGFGQSLAWGAQVTYVQKLAMDYAHLSKELTYQELSKFNGIFLACFQTAHIWGNLVSSVMLQTLSEDHEHQPTGDMTLGLYCGVYDHCEDRTPIPLIFNISEADISSASNAVLKLMGSYLVFAFTGFILIVLFLEKIGAKTDTEKPCLQMVWSNVQQLFKHKTYRWLVPLLVFNGFEQGFVYADYNKSYITCTIGVEYVGYNMITLGMTNSIFSVLVGMVAKHLPREAIIGIGGILHIGLMVFLLVWIPDKDLKAVFFVISALWGICDAIWQTQCNSLVSLSCPDDHDVAFQNFRMLQGLGAALVFILGAFFCVAVKLYVIISLIILSIFFYVIAEYRIRKDQGLMDDSS